MSKKGLFQRKRDEGSILVRAAGVLALLAAAAFGQSEKQTKTKGPSVKTSIEEKKLQFDLVKGKTSANIVVAKAEAKGVHRAARDLQRDITKITGYTPNILYSLDGAGSKCVVIASADCAEGRALLKTIGVPTSDLDGKWECFKYRVLNHVGGKQQVLAIVGSNLRGTIFGVYDFEQKHMGVDPFWFWADHEPAAKPELIYDEDINFGPTNEPTWKYRGWTLNDHPQFIEWM